MTRLATPAPAATPTSGIDLGSALHDVWTGAWSAITSSPWVGALAVLTVVGGAVRLVRAVAYPSSHRDPLRRFTREDKAEILRRAGHRCEFHGLFGRCAAAEGLEADHVIPWSRSGATILGNGQALCRRHNREKRASVPFRWQLRGLERRRAGYYPPDVSGAVVHRRG